MERPNFFQDQLVLPSDLNEIITAVSLELARRIQGNLGYSGGFNETSLAAYTRNKAGILGSPGDSSSNKNLKVTEGLASNQLIVYTGSALDTDGELIYIDTSQTLQRGITTTNYQWDTTVGTNYVKLSYMETSGSIKTDDTGTGYPTRYTSSWFITIDGVSPLTTELLLATFTGDGSGNVTASSVLDTRLYTRVYTFADAVGVDPYNTAVSSIKTVGEHLRATGSATPTANNPHGIAYADLGGNNLLLPISHATNMHISCVIPYVKTTASFDSYKGVVVNPTSNAYVTFTTPNTAVLVAGGQVFSGSLTNLYAIDAYNIAGNGVYFAVVDNDGNTSWKLLSSFTVDSLFTATVDGNTRYATGHRNPNYYILGYAIISDNGDDITAWIDSRLLYGTHPIDIGADYSESVLDPNSGAGSLTRGSTLLTNLSRLRYQLGKAINGTGSLWNTSTYPLTAGPTSDADSYHTHASLLNTAFDYFKLENQLDQTIPPFSGFDENTPVEVYMGNVHQLKWEAVTNNGIAHITSIGSSGNIALVADQSGTYEVEYQLFVRGSSSTTDDSIYTEMVSTYSSGGVPVWKFSGLGDFYIKSSGGETEGVTIPLRGKGYIDLIHTDEDYNKVIILANHYSTGSPSNPVITSNIGDFSYTPGTGSIGGLGTWLKATLIKRA